MNNGHIEFTIIKEEFNEYDLESGLFLRVKPIVVDLVTKGSQSGFAVIFDLFSKLVRSTYDSSGDAKYDETKQLQFRPRKEVVNIYETQSAIILVAYQLSTIFTSNQRDNEGLPILRLEGETLFNVVDKPTRSISKRDKDVFRNVFWTMISERYRDLIRNTNTTDFVFDVDGITRPIQEGGLGINGFEQPFIEQMLREIQAQDGLIELIPGQRRFRLSPQGIEYCRRLP